MSEIFERHARSVDEYVVRFKALERQRGAIFTVHGRPTGLELFDRAETWRRMMPKLTRSYAIDTIDQPMRETVRRRRATALLTTLARVRTAAYPNVGEGITLRLQGTLTGAALALDGRLLHLAAFVEDGLHTPSHRSLVG